jgi:O-antigen/teichoic acid export membrane protein
VLTHKELLSYALQLANGLTPLIAIPLVSRENGAEGLSAFFISLSISGITQIVCDYGFNISAIRDSTHQLTQNNPGEHLRRLLVGTILAKLIIATAIIFASPIIASYLSSRIAIASNYIQVTIILSTLISIFNQSWYLYSIKMTHTYNAVLFILKLGILVSFMYYGTTLWFLLLFILGPNLIVNIYSTFKCWRDVSQYKTNTSIVNLILNSFQRGGPTFLNTITASGIATLWPIYIGMTATALEVSLFGLADRIIKGFMMFVTPLPSFILAKKQLTSIFHPDYQHNLVKMIMLGLLPAGIVSLLPQRFFALILGTDFTFNQSQLSILTLALPVVIANSISYVHLLLKRREISFSFVYPIGACLSITSVFITHSSTVFTPLISEIFAFTLLFTVIARERSY